MLNKWKESFRVNSHDTDTNGVVRASVMLRYLQECANLQMYNCHPTPDELTAANKAFILSRMSMVIHRPLHAFEYIDVESWGCESRGATFNRCGKITCGSEAVAEIFSVWGLLDTVSRRICRVDDLEMGFGVSEMLDLGIPTRFRIPAEFKLAILGQRRICYSDIDLNRHMNNTNYPDMLCDFLSSMNGRRVSEMSINFIGEAALDEVITVTGCEVENTAYFRTLRESGAVGVEAEMRFEKL